MKGDTNQNLRVITSLHKIHVISPNFLVYKFCGKAQFLDQEIR